MNVLQKDLAEMTRQMEQTAPPAGPWRLDFHLMPPVGWMNDPNGLCYFHDEYHVFYQYSPFSAEGGVKFWGHYKSRNLLLWERCPAMLYSDEAYDVHGAYSGSALCTEDGMYLYYTGNVKHSGGYDYVRAGRENNTVLAYSPDGIHLAWKRLLMRNGDYPAGMTLHVRDPKVWEMNGKYYMVQGARTVDDTGAVLVFASDDKLNWKHINTLRTTQPFGYMWECPDLFEIDGQWILLISPQGVNAHGPGFENKYTCGYFPLYGDFRGEYMLGDFVPLDYGFDFYAAQTFSDGKRRMLTGWMGMPDADYRNPTTLYGWQHCLTVMRELRYAHGCLYMSPVQEMEMLRENSRKYVFRQRTAVELPHTADIHITCEKDLELDLSGVSLRTEKGVMVLSLKTGGYGRTSRTAPVRKLRNIRILMDRSALEIFVNDGETVLTTRWYPETESRTLTLYGSGTVSVHNLQPVHIETFQ